MTLLGVMHALYASNISSGMASQRYAAVRVWLGDERSGIRAVREFSPDELDDAAVWLADEARARFPDSDFARTTVTPRKPQRHLTLIWARNSH